MVKMKETIIKEYCAGCGLCKTVKNIDLQEYQNGQYYPAFKNDDEIEFCSLLCPSNGYFLRGDRSTEVWGHYLSVCYGFSTNKDIRAKASSGGVLSSLAIYLLEQKIVDGIIHIEADPEVPYKTILTVSSSATDVLRHAGSRYCISPALIRINEIIDRNKKYAFIGKPCDVAVLNQYLEMNGELKKNIEYVFSFFCAGQPSNIAQLKLLKELGCSDSNQCISLTYRGNGWPGMTTCVYKDGSSRSMSYEESWGTILGRDVKNACRFCVDGIGLCADIACGDAWYLDANNKPKFEEREGRNIILSRTEKGEKLLRDLHLSGYITLEEADIKMLKYMQPYQFERRATMLDKIIALKIMGRSTPRYSFKYLLTLAKYVGLRRHLSILKGTIIRIKNGRI